MYFEDESTESSTLELLIILPGETLPMLNSPSCMLALSVHNLGYLGLNKALLLGLWTSCYLNNYLAALPFIEIVYS